METLRAMLLLFSLTLHLAEAVDQPVRVHLEGFQAPLEAGAPNTFIGTGRQIGSSLLDAATPALMFGVISSASVSAVCQQIASTGSFVADVTTTLGSTTTQAVVSSRVTAMEGCANSDDASETQALMVDDESGRQSVLVCPNDAGATGCAIYLTGDDVTDLYNQRALRRRLLHHRSCAGEAKHGAISGTITGVLAVTACAAFSGFMAPFCAAGMLGASAGLGAAASCASSCFPGDATVTMADGRLIQMTALALGDKIVAMSHDGHVAFEDVYAFGHKDASATATFVQLTLQPIHSNMSDHAKTLELTALHFVPILSGTRLLYKRAQDLIKGDKMLTDSMVAYVVTRTSEIQKQGLYNPFTLSGTIIVNGVVASSHSDWFLDSIFEYFNLVHWLPQAYQLVLFPVRMLYYCLGKSLYISVYQKLDSLVDVSKFGGAMVTTLGLIPILTLPKLVTRCRGQPLNKSKQTMGKGSILVKKIQYM